MATLYTHAESNILKTWALLGLFFVLIIGLGWFVSYQANNPSLLYFAVIFSILMSFGSYWFSDKIVLSMTKAKPIEEKGNPDLYRTVENLCITAGLPMPKIYILEENQANAFATGRDKNHAVVAVTRGLLSKLNKTELEGVIAHELSHIGNRDMLLSTIVVVLVGVISIVSDLFFRMSFFGRRRDDDNRGGGSAIFMVLGLLAIVLAPIAAMLLQLAISRKREFLADASGALLTRYPEGLISALEKISSDPNSLRVANNLTAHLYIYNPFRGKQSVNWLTKLFMTHPPLEDRIKALRQIVI